MKLAKLSLAAIVAAGAMTTFANAAPLEEAIKGVEVSGMMRYRFYNHSDEVQSATAPNPGESASNRYRMSAPITFVVPVADNLTAGTTVRYEMDNYTKTQTNQTNEVDAVKYWFKYATPEYSLRAGMFEISSPWTETGYGGSRGEGMLAMYTGVENWAFAGGFWMNTRGVSLGGTNDLFAAAALGSAGPVNLQFWAAKMVDVFESSFFIQADTKFEGFTLKAQANQLEVELPAGSTAEDTGLFWGVEAGFGMDGFKVGAGYTQNDDEQAVYSLDDDNDGMIKAGKQIYYMTNNELDAETMFITAGYSFDKYRVGAGYVTAERTNDSADVATTGGYEMDETYVEAGYKYSKNFDLSFYYSMYEGDDAGDEDDEFRFQAIYTF